MSKTSALDQIFVPIVGRPNVGKSTLFNRLAGEERALTGSEPGVTRDRISTDVEWNSRNLTLIDTAGYDRADGDTLPDPEFVLDQVEAMIEAGDCLLFVVDGEQGITPLDREIAERLYPVDERVILVVNKVDPGRDPETYKSSFYELGISTVQAVSALHGDGVASLRETVQERVPERTVELPDEGIRLSLVGRPNVGKSTMVNTILGYDRVMVSEEPGTTRDLVSVSFDVDDQRFHMMDTGGMLRRDRVEEEIQQKSFRESLRALNFSDVVGFMLDWEGRVTKQDQRIAGLIKDRYRGCIIMVNKADEPDEETENRWLTHIRERLYFLDYAPILFTSGKERRGLEALFRISRRIHDEMHQRFASETLTNALLDVKSKLSWPSSSARDVVLTGIGQAGVDPVTLRVTAREPSRLTERDVRHLNRLLREELKLEISPLKLRFEEPTDDE